MRPLSVLFTITITFIFSGCVASPSPQIANIDKINSFRDYVIQKRSNEVGNYDVVATTANKTLLELRVFNEPTSTTDTTDVLKVLDDAGNEINGLEFVSVNIFNAITTDKPSVSGEKVIIIAGNIEELTIETDAEVLWTEL